MLLWSVERQIRVRFLRSLGRTLQVVGYMASGVTELLLKRPTERQARAEWLHQLCARALRGLEIEIDVVGEFPGHGAVISNHLSYADIIVFAALHRCVFVSKAEIENWPVIGWMTTMSGTVYVARGHGGSAVKAREGVSEAFDAGLPVVFFPEGTTSNGNGLLKFHSGLLAQVLAENAPVTAAHVSYKFTEDNGPGVTVEDDVCYWGDRDMWSHIFRFLGLRGVRAEVRFAPEPILFQHKTNRKLAAQEAEAAVAELGGVSAKCTISDSTNVHAT
jgi:lyso-ornithine lipid O-acyltransferase